MSRLSGDCLKFFQDLSGIDDARTLREKLETYLKENAGFGDRYLAGSALQLSPFSDEGLGAVTTRIEISGQMRPGQGVTEFNAGSSFFTGKLTLNSGRVVSFMEPGRITPQSSIYGLSLPEIQQLVVLHELAFRCCYKSLKEKKRSYSSMRLSISLKLCL